LFLLFLSALEEVLNSLVFDKQICLVAEAYRLKNAWRIKQDEKEFAILQLALQ